MAFNWKDVGDFIGKVAPTVGSLLGPAGAAVGTLISSALGTDNNPDAVMKELKNNPDAIIKIKEIEANKQVELEKIAASLVQEDTKALQSINQTMQVELQNSDKETWYQKGWRPANGFAVAIGSLGAVFFVFYLFYKALTDNTLTANLPAILAMIPNLAMSVASLLAIPGAAVGISAWHRGLMKRDQ